MQNAKIKIVQKMMTTVSNIVRNARYQLRENLAKVYEQLLSKPKNVTVNLFARKSDC